MAFINPLLYFTNNLFIYLFLVFFYVDLFTLNYYFEARGQNFQIKFTNQNRVSATGNTVVKSRKSNGISYEFSSELVTLYINYVFE